MFKIKKKIKKKKIKSFTASENKIWREDYDDKITIK